MPSSWHSTFAFSSGGTLLTVPGGAYITVVTSMISSVAAPDITQKLTIDVSMLFANERRTI